VLSVVSRGARASGSCGQALLSPISVRTLDRVLLQGSGLFGLVLEQFPGWRIPVEFRNPSWIPHRTDEVLRILADHGLIYVALDCPWQPFIPAATTDWAVLRFPGRNAQAASTNPVEGSVGLSRHVVPPPVRLVA
jgi:hypothetical protein